MKVINIHSRIINQPIEEVGILLASLSSRKDEIWPLEKWPAIRFKQGLQLNAKGGHGPIRYYISKYVPSNFIEFTFTNPKGFLGIHSFDIQAISDDSTEIKHTIDMRTKGVGTVTWLVAVKWLHDALLEDSLDKVENHFNKHTKTTKMNLYVRLLRWLVKKRR